MIEAYKVLKMIHEAKELSPWFEKGQFYYSVPSPFGGIDIISYNGTRINLIKSNGEFTDNADYFSLCKDETILPSGSLQ